MRLIYGTARLWKCGTKRVEIVSQFLSSTGIGEIDTAPMYGEGLSELSIRYLNENIDDLLINTKVGLKARFQMKRQLMARLRLGSLVDAAERRIFGDMRSRREVVTSESCVKQLMQSINRIGCNRLNQVWLHEPRAQSRKELLGVKRVIEEVDAIGAKVVRIGIAGDQIWNDIAANEAMELLEWCKHCEIPVQTSVESYKRYEWLRRSTVSKVLYGVAKAAREDGTSVTSLLERLKDGGLVSGVIVSPRSVGHMEEIHEWYNKIK